MEEGDDLVKTLLRSAKVTERFNHKDYNDCLRLSAAVQRFTESDWQNAITEDADEIIFTAYLQEGWCVLFEPLSKRFLHRETKGET